jgi:hypothetical protein
MFTRTPKARNRNLLCTPPRANIGIFYYAPCFCVFTKYLKTFATVESWDILEGENYLLLFIWVESLLLLLSLQNHHNY